MMPTRGVLYLACDEDEAQRSARSIEALERFGLDYCVRKVDPSGNGLAKVELLGLSPFHETLFLAPNAVVLDDVSLGFEMAGRHGCALSMAPACWARRQWAEEPGALKRVHPEIPEYDLGAIFYVDNTAMRVLFETWRSIVDEYGSCEQWGFSQAVYETRFNPYVLPENWNFHARPIVCGPIKIWNSRQTPPRNIDWWNRECISLGSIEHGTIKAVGWYPSAFQAGYPAL
jgi:hypothetical protein